MEETYQAAAGEQVAHHRGLDELVIPELESAPPPRNRPWSVQEEEILQRYYMRVSTKKLVEYYRKNFPPGRTISSIRSKARDMGLGDG